MNQIISNGNWRGMLMKRVGVLLFVFFLAQGGRAQIVPLGVRTGAASTNVLLATSTAGANNHAKTISLYTASEIYAAGGGAGEISRLWWTKEGTGEYNSGDAELIIWMKHVTDSAWSSVPDFATELAGAQQVFSNGTYSLPAGTGWIEVPFQSVFRWNGVDNIAVFVQWFRLQNPTAAINWARSTTTNANATRVGSSPALVLTVNSNRPLVQFDIKKITSGNNIGISRLESPINFCSGNNPVQVEVMNYGGNVVNSFQVQWSMNGVPQTTMTYNTPLDTFGSPAASTVVTLGNYNFSAAGVQLVAHTLLPNGQVDSLRFNDSLTATLKSSISGTLTVNAGAPASATNFRTFAALSDSLSKLGVCGPVTVNVVPGSGPYNETVFFGEVPGAGPANPIRINGGGNIVTDSTISTNRQLLTLSGTRNMRIDSLNFITRGLSYGYGALLTNGAAYDSITNCTFDLSSLTATTSGYGAGIVFSNSITSATTVGTNGNHCYIAGNRITGPSGTGGIYHGITVVGASNDNIIRNNIVENFYYYGLYISAASGTIVEGNEFHRSNKTASLATTTYVVFTTGNTPNTRIIGNRVHDPVGTGASSTSAFTAFRLTGSGTANEPVIVANNLAYNINMGGLSYGFYFSASAYNLVYHNTVVFDKVFGSTVDNVGFYATGDNSGTEFKNNLVSITAGGTGTKYGFYYNAANSVMDAQRNNFYINSTQSGTQNYGYYTSAFASRNDFLLAYPALESGSLTVDPSFVAPATGDLLPANMMLQGGGVDLTAIVPADILGNPRSQASTPGAFEISMISGLNAGVGAKVAPSGLFCEGVESIGVTVVNSGSSMITSMDVHWTFNGVPQAPYTYTGQLDTPGSATGNQDTIYLGPINIPAGSNALRVWTVLNGDVNHGNDTLDAIIQPSLSGTYTLNSAAPTAGRNFNNFADLTSVFSLNGVCGPVVIDVVPGSGPYTENISFGAIPGVSPVATVRINGNGNRVEYGTGATAGQRQLLTLSGTKHLRIDSLNFKTLGTVGWGALFTGGSQFDSLINCFFDLTVLTGTTTANGSGIVFSNSISSTTTTGKAGSHCYISGNHLLGPTTAGGPYHGVSIVGGGNDSNIIYGNVFENFYYYGVSLSAVTGTQVIANELHRKTKTTTTIGYGIYTTGALPGTLIEGNKIHDPIDSSSSSTSAFNGLRLTGDGTIDDPVIAANNVIYNINQGGASYGIYLSAALHNKVYHNTVAFNRAYTGTGANAGIYATGVNTGAEVINNIVSITAGSGGTKHGFYYNALTSIGDAQRNNIYVNSTQPGTQNYGYYTTAYPTHAAFVADYPQFEAGSQMVDPQFTDVERGDLFPANMALQANGVNLSGTVPTDILGIPRSVASSPGAYEIPAPVGYNPGADALVGPTGIYCEGQQQVLVSVINSGSTQIDTMEVHWSLNGQLQTPYMYSGLLDTAGSAGGNIDTLLLGTVHIPAGQNELVVWTVISNDVNNANDTLKVTLSPAKFEVLSVYDTACVGTDAILRLSPGSGYVPGMIGWERSLNGTAFVGIPGSDTTVYNAGSQSANTWYRAKINAGVDGCYSDTFRIISVDPSVLSLTDGSHCGPGQVNLSAVPAPGTTLQWFDSPLAGVPVGSGNSFTTPMLTASTTYYVAGISGTGGGVHMGPVNPVSVGSAGGYSTLATYRTYFTVHNITRIESVDIFPNAASVGLSSSIEIIDSATGALIASIPYTVTSGGNLNTGQTVVLNQRLPPGKYAMKMSNAVVSLYRNTSGSQFPYRIPDLSITGQSFNNYPQYYYYFFNWKVGSGCTGPRQPVVATISSSPAISIQSSTGAVCAGDSVSLTAISSNPGYVYSWTPGNQTGSTVTVIPVQSSFYHVRAVDNSGGIYNGCANSDSVFVPILPLPLASVTSNGPTSFCEGEGVSLIATSGVGYTYQWIADGQPVLLPAGGNSTYAVSASGRYSVRISDLNQCSAVSPAVSVTVYPIPEPVIYPNGGELSTGNYNSYLWKLNDIPIPGATERSYRVTQSGKYTVSVTDDNGCTGTSEVWQHTLSVADGALANTPLRIYPNPATDLLHVDAPSDVHIIIGGIDGKLLMQQEHTRSIDVSRLPDGLYIVRINDSEGRLIQVERFMKASR